MTPETREAWRDAAGVTALALAVRLLVVALAMAVFKDSTIYLRAAQAFAAGDVAGGLAPPYPPLTALIAALPLVCGLPADPWAAIAIALASAPAAGFLALAAREGWPRRVAIAAGVFLAVAPAMARPGGAVLSQGPHLTLVCATAWMGARMLRDGVAPAWALGAGVAAGLAFLGRPEGLLAGAAVGVACVARVARPAGGSRGRAVLAAACVAAGAAASVVPYVIHASAVEGAPTFSRKKSLGEVLVVHRVGYEQAAGAREESGRGLGMLAAKAPRDALATAGELAQAWHPLFAVLAIVGLWAGRRSLVADVGARPSRRLLAWTGGAFAALALAHAISLDYVSDRHLLPAAALWLPWSAAGACALPELFARLRRGWTPPAWSAAAVVTLAAVVAGAKSLVPLEGRRQAEVSLGRALAARIPPGAIIVSNLPRVSWYAGARAHFLPWGASPDAVLAYARAIGAAAIVCDAEDIEKGLDGARPTHPGLLARLEAEAPPLVRTPVGDPDDYRAYAVPRAP